MSLPTDSHPETRLRSRLIAASPVYYGWVVVGAAMLAFAATLPGQTAGVSLFIDHFIADLGVSREAVSLAYTFATVLAALALPFVGRAYDRYGPRAGALVVGVLFAGAVAGMSQVGGLATLFVGFVLLRGLGQGGLSLASLHAVNLWFVQRRGLAVGLMGIGMALATAFGPPLLEAGIASVGWRATYAVMGGVLLVVLVPVALLLRSAPERYGLGPDGPIRADDPPPRVEVSLSLAEARRTGTFWLLVGGLAITNALGTGLLFHHIAIMDASGVGRAAAAQLFVPYGLVTVLAGLTAGTLIDRLGPRRVLAAFLAAYTGMMLAIPFVTSPGLVWTYGAVFGLTQGFQNNLAGSAFAYYYGRAHIGAIKGYTKTLLIAGTAAGPPLVAFGATALGGYDGALWALAILPASGAALALLRRFERAAA